MRGVRSRGSGDALFGSAGWLFADLMLALVMMAILAATISQQTQQTPPPAAPTPVITTTTTTTTPPVTSTTAPPELLQIPVHVDLEVNPADLANPGAIGGIQQYVHAQLAAPLQGRRVGFVLTFGTGSTAQITQAINEATTFNNVVLQPYGPQFAGAVYRSYFQGGADTSKISLDLFVFDH